MAINIVVSEDSDFGKLSELFPELEVNIYNLNNYKEQKKGYKIKGGYSAKLSPFAVLLDNDKAVKAFYSEVKECTLENIINFITNYGTSRNSKENN